LITDLANLGPSLRGTTDLGSAKSKEAKPTQSGKPDTASSFGEVLKGKESNKDVRAQTLKKDPASVPTKTDDKAPGKVDTDRVEVSSSKNEPRTAQKNNESWDELESVKTKGQGETVGKKANSSSTREQVMLEFMDSMESEFGILPQEMVGAMTQIPESDQFQSPEASASQVIAQLELPEDQEQKALALYVGMLAQLQQSQQQPMGRVPALSATAAVATAPVMLSSRQRRDMLNQSLDQMNQKFFMQGAGRQSPMEAAQKSMDPMMTEKRLGADPMAAFPQDQVSFGDQAAFAKTPGLNPNENLLKESPLQYEQSRPLKGQALPEGMEQIDPNSKEGQQLMKSLAALGAATAALNQELRADPKTAQAFQAEQALNGLNEGTQIPSDVGMEGFGLDGEDEEMGGFGKESSPDTFFAPQAQASSGHAHRAEASGSNHQSFSETMAVGGAAGAMAARNQDPAENQANVQQLMKQAQYMIKKGGGEAKIQMAPEGIGQVHMKVVVNEGKVNLEMSAETKEAKKLIENSLSDLKASLGQHKLTMDQVKVDVGNQASSDNKNSDAQQQQRQMDMRQDQGKDQTRNFWSEYRQNGGFDRRGGFHENSGIKAYGGNSRQVEALTPGSGGAVEEKRFAGSGKGRGLNLVA